MRATTYASMAVLVLLAASGTGSAQSTQSAAIPSCVWECVELDASDGFGFGNACVNSGPNQGGEYCYATTWFCAMSLCDEPQAILNTPDGQVVGYRWGNGRSRMIATASGSTSNLHLTPKAG